MALKIVHFGLPNSWKKYVRQSKAELCKFLVVYGFAKKFLKEMTSRSEATTFTEVFGVGLFINYVD